MAKKAKNPASNRGAAPAHGHTSDGDRLRWWLRPVAFAVLTAHSAFSAYLARDNALFLALVVVGYLLLLPLLLFYRFPALRRRD